MSLPGAVRSVTRRRRWQVRGDQRAQVGAAWRELRDTAVDVRAPWDDGRSPRQLATTLTAAVSLDPNQRAALDRLVVAEQEARYAAEPAPLTGDLRSDVEGVRSGLLSNRGHIERWRTRVWPRSVMLAVTRRLSQLADLIGHVEALPGRAHAALRSGRGVRLRQPAQRSS
jgi:hypothetical protein